MTGSIINNIDVAQVVLYLFWGFFAALIIYLRREDKREGYPLRSDRTDRAKRVRVQGFPPIPRPKRFKLAHGEDVLAPRDTDRERELAARPVAPWPGAPLAPVGDPLRDGVGPASYALRADTPDLTAENEPKMVPLRADGEFSLEPRDPDPRGMAVVGADGEQAGTVSDVWIDRAEIIARYFEVELPDGRHVLLPVNFSRIDKRSRKVRVRSLLADQFAGIPPTAEPDQVTLLEEERICAYFGGGTLYALPSRSEPLL